MAFINKIDSSFNSVPLNKTQQKSDGSFEDLLKKR